MPRASRVGFISGMSSICKTVTLANDSYTLSLVAAQSSSNQTRQSLTVFVDQTPVGTIDPSDMKYAQFRISFTVGAGPHTITFQGTKAGKSTVLIDAVAFQTTNSSPHRSGKANAATMVEFLVPPSSGTAAAECRRCSCEVFDRSGALWSGREVSLILIRIGKGSREHIVRGSMRHAKAVGGVATFHRLIIRAPGQYVLRAKFGRHHVDSAPFEIDAALPH